jgi:cytochrome c oxidase subunit II
MKTPLKLILAAAAFALAPAAAFSQAAAASAPAAAGPAAQTPRDAISARSQAAPAQPEEMNQPSANQEEPSNAQVLATSPARVAADATVGQPTGDWRFQPQVTPIGQEAL